MSAKVDLDEFGVHELSDATVRLELRRVGAKLFNGKGDDADQLYFSLLALEKHRRAAWHGGQRA